MQINLTYFLKCGPLLDYHFSFHARPGYRERLTWGLEVRGGADIWIMNKRIDRTSIAKSLGSPPLSANVWISPERLLAP